MALIDERGRLFGRLNLIDAAMGVLMLALVGGVLVGYRLLRLPNAPVIVKVDPEVQQGGDGRSLTLVGRNFLPFMRVFIQRTGVSPKPVHEKLSLDRTDDYTLVNFSQARFLVESPLIAQVRLPDSMGPGVYDLVFYNETQQVAVKEAAFRLTNPPPPPPPPPSVPRAAVRFYGAFIAIDRATPPHVEPGMKLPTGQADAWAQILEVQPSRPETAPVRSQTADFPADVEGRMQVPAVLRVRCVVAGLLCNTTAGNLTIGNTFPIQVGGKTLQFHVDDIGPDADEVVRQAVVEVRFFTKPEIAKLVRAGDVDRSRLAPGTRVTRAAVIASRSPAEEFPATVSISLAEGAQSLTLQDKGVAFNANLTIPLMQLPTGWFYRGLAIKAGSNMQFDTSTYVVRGMILGVTLPDAKPSGRSATR